MNLRRKTLLAVGATLVVLLVTHYVISRTFLLESYSRHENQLIALSTRRVIAAFAEVLAGMDRMALDYATWDDTYRFVHDGNEGYIGSNLTDDTFRNLSLNFMLYVDETGAIVFSKSFDSDRRQQIPHPQGLLDHPAFRGTLLYHPVVTSGASGVILLSQGPMLVVSRPILTSQREGPPRGSVIMGRYLDEKEVARIGEKVKQPLSVYPFVLQGVPSDVQTARSFLSQSAPVFVHPTNADTIAGYGLVSDVNGLPGLVVKTDMPRDIYKQGAASLGYLLSAIVAAGLVIAIVVLFLLNRMIFSRLSQLSTAVRRIRANEDFSLRVAVEGKDELASVASDINYMLGAMGRSHRLLRESEERYRAIIEDQVELVYRFLPHGQVTFVNPAYCRFYSGKPSQLIGTHVFDAAPAGERRKAEIQLDGILRKRLPGRLEYRVQLPDGSVRLLKATIRPILDGNLRVSEIQAVGSEVAEYAEAGTAVFAGR